MMRISDRRTTATANPRIRRSNKKSFAPSCLTTFAALTLAGMYFMSPTIVAFTPPSKSSRPSIDRGIVRAAGTSSPQLAPLSPFGTKNNARSSPSLIPKSTRLYSTPGPDADREEWRAMLAAFQMYKAAYGDLKIPTRFVVPAMPPWPEAAWEMKLGRLVSAIRTTGKYVQDNPRRRQQLDKLGFVWRVRAPTQSANNGDDIPFDQVYEALVVYRQEEHPVGVFSVPLQFTVPDSEPWPERTRGMPLGRCAQRIAGEKFLRSDPEAAKKLKELGFQTAAAMSANEVRFQNVFTALERYQEIYGDMLVPQPFEVPSNQDWPEQTWGLRLGARVNAIRSQGTFLKNEPQRREMLDAIGFVWSPPESERRKRGRKSKAEKELEEQEATKAAAGSVDPSSDSQDDAQDMDSLMSSFDFSGTSDSDGAESTAPTWGFEGGQAMQDAMVAAQEEAAEKASKDEYKPPRTLGESLAEAKARAIACGVIQEGEGKTLIKGKQEKESAWFNDDFGGYFVFEDVVEALTLYKKFYGNFSNLTNEEFVIPVQDDSPSPFDEDDDYDDLGMMGDDPASRAAGAVSRFEEFDDLAMTEDMMEAEISRLEQVIAPELEPELAVATALVSQVEVDWPDHLGGMRLGNIVTRIRDGSLEVKHLPERKAQLDAIDFDWGDPKYFLDVPFEKAMCAMYGYYLVRGDMFVHADFVMPDEDPWPKALAGYEIGKVVQRIRQLQNFLEAYHTEKVRLLRMIDFVWFPTLALPLDPDEAEVTPESIHLCAMGHPDYAQIRDLPMGLPDKIMADGPFYDSDDPKDWWRVWHNWDYVEEYWYAKGRRDNALALRGMGYHQMAAEHEEKYGPGLFEQISKSLTILESGKRLGAEDQVEMQGKLKYYRQELEGCTDIAFKELEKLILQIEEYMEELETWQMEGSAPKREPAVDMQDLEVEYYEEEVEDEAAEEYEEEETEESDEYEYEYEYVEEEIDVGEELGLDSSDEESS